MTIDEKLGALSDITKKIESADTKFEDAMAAFEEGTKIIKELQSVFNSASDKVDFLIANIDKNDDVAGDEKGSDSQDACDKDTPAVKKHTPSRKNKTSSEAPNSDLFDALNISGTRV